MQGVGAETAVSKIHSYQYDPRGYFVRCLHFKERLVFYVLPFLVYNELAHFGAVTTPRYIIPYQLEQSVGLDVAGGHLIFEIITQDDIRGQYNEIPHEPADSWDRPISRYYLAYYILTTSRPLSFYTADQSRTRNIW